MRRYELSLPQYKLLQALQQGKNMGQALEACADHVPEEQLDQLADEVQLWFRNWTGERCFFQALVKE